MSIDVLKSTEEDVSSEADVEPPIDMDEVCLRLHDELFSRTVGATRKSAIIFQFKVNAINIYQ